MEIMKEICSIKEGNHYPKMMREGLRIILYDLLWYTEGICGNVRFYS